jgi:hypothetical protein
MGKRKNEIDDIFKDQKNPTESIHKETIHKHTMNKHTAEPTKKDTIKKEPIKKLIPSSDKNKDFYDSRGTKQRSNR